MAATDDLVSLVIKEIDAKIASFTSTLLAADHTRHDKLCGIIIGLNEAKSFLKEKARDYRMGDRDDDEIVPYERIGHRGRA